MNPNADVEIHETVGVERTPYSCFSFALPSAQTTLISEVHLSVGLSKPCVSRIEFFPVLPQPPHQSQLRVTARESAGARHQPCFRGNCVFLRSMSRGRGGLWSSVVVQLRLEQTWTSRLRVVDAKPLSLQICLTSDYQKQEPVTVHTGTFEHKLLQVQPHFIRVVLTL
jgi:hypothetical protein